MATPDRPDCPWKVWTAMDSDGQLGPVAGCQKASGRPAGFCARESRLPRAVASAAPWLDISPLHPVSSLGKVADEEVRG